MNYDTCWEKAQSTLRTLARCVYVYSCSHLKTAIFTYRSTYVHVQKSPLTYSQCYSLAVKSYNSSETAAYQLELDAFEALRHTSGVVKYFGNYTGLRGQSLVTHHILLEYGSHDLDEYLAVNFPPVLYRETKAFWESLFEVVETLKGLHTLEYEGTTLSG